jgi:acetate kinase
VFALTVNSGSTSVKLAAFASAGSDVQPLRREQHQGRGLDARAVLRAFLRELDPSQLIAVAHRVVHGGTRFAGPVLIDASVEAAIRELSELAPLHNPVALEWIAAAQVVCGREVPQVAAFDTAFFTALPRIAAEYALPSALGADLGVRRYGFHGLAHQAMWQRWCALHPQLPQGGRIVTLQLGGGSSAAAIERGRAIDTSMGFSPLEGLVMGTRSGDLDPAAVVYLAAKQRTSSERIIDWLNHECGLKGVSGVSGEMRQLLGEPRSPAAQFAIELYCYRATQYLGAYLAVLRGCDGIVFGGGVGEHAPEVRARILAPLAWAGVEIDPQANDEALGNEARISRSGSAIEVQVIPNDEDRLLASAAFACAAPHTPMP